MKSLKMKMTVILISKAITAQEKLEKSKDEDRQDKLKPKAQGKVQEDQNA